MARMCKKTLMTQKHDPEHHRMLIIGTQLAKYCKRITISRVNVTLPDINTLNQPRNSGQGAIRAHRAPPIHSLPNGRYKTNGIW